jgi:K+-transporting ATPase c subunit
LFFIAQSQGCLKPNALGVLMPNEARESGSKNSTQTNQELIEKLAEKVYRLMLEDLKHSKLRGDTRSNTLRR